MDEIIPSDLNTIMAVNEAYLVKLAQKFKREDLKIYYLKCIKDRKDYFNSIKGEDGRYPDFRMIESASVYPSDYYPNLLFPEKINI